jgi:hypothetical protein
MPSNDPSSQIQRHVEIWKRDCESETATGRQTHLRLLVLPFSRRPRRPPRAFSSSACAALLRYVSSRAAPSRADGRAGPRTTRPHEAGDAPPRRACEDPRCTHLSRALTLRCLQAVSPIFACWRARPRALAVMRPVVRVSALRLRCGQARGGALWMMSSVDVSVDV